MANLYEMFTKEDRVELTVSQLIEILEEQAWVNAENIIMKKMLDENFTAYEISKVFCEKPDYTVKAEDSADGD